MPSIVLVGAQWGDEGKGKITDMLSESVDVVVRYQGGNNAGHTLNHKGQEYKLHLIPSGILYPDKINVLADGLVMDLGVLLGEIEALETRGVDCSNLRISKNAHLIMPYHRVLDQKEEELRGKHKIGTTGRGIGPCYQDKMSRRGIRMMDLYDPEEFEGKLGHTLKYKNLLLRNIFDHEGFERDQILEECYEFGRRLKPYVADTSLLVRSAYMDDKTILFEGAQGTLLDIDSGTYPYVTSSHPVAGGATLGTGLGPGEIDRVIGVTKAYTTRVGEGPFPAEILGDVGERIRAAGGEFGTTTGRPRRCGWLDVVALRYAVRVNGLNTLAMTKLDVLDEFDEVRLCVGYRYNGDRINDFSTEFMVLRDCEPIYETMEGWKTDTTEMKTFEELPATLKRYIQEVEKMIRTPISIISVGPERAQTLILRKLI